MKLLLISSLLVIQSAFGQIVVACYNNPDSIVSLDKIPGTAVYEIDESKNVINYTQRDAHGMVFKKREFTILASLDTPVSHKYIVQFLGSVFELIFFKDKELVRYNYADDTFALVNGTVRY